VKLRVRYDFDRVIERRGTGSTKWDMLGSRFGAPDALPMWVADMDFESPRPVVDALIQRAQHGVYGYTLKPDDYFDAIVGWQKRRHGWQIQPEWLSESPGVVSGLSWVVDALTQPGDRILIQPPVYHPFAALIQALDRTVVENPLRLHAGRYTMDFDDLRRKVRGCKAIILCSPHNPVGRVWTAEELRELGGVCLENGVLVLSDEIHADLIYRGSRHTPFGSLGEAFARGSVTCIAPSKTFNLAGLATSVVILPDPELKARYEAHLNRLHVRAGGIFGNLAMTVAYREGEPWLDQLMDYLGGNRDLVLEHLSRGPLQPVAPEGTYLMWLDCRALGLADEPLDQFFRQQAKVVMNAGAMFGTGGSGFMRMNVGCPRSMVADALSQIEGALGRLRREA
jgi:cystathionine beta-lyase